MEIQSIDRADWELAQHDIGVWAFGGLELAALLVSMPQTYAIIARYHARDQIGTIQAVASLIVFEAGAVISKLATLLFPQWRGRLTALQFALLAFVAGANAFATTAAASADEQVQAFFFAGLLPFFQALFLALCVARIKALHVARLTAQEAHQPSQAERLTHALAVAQERAFTALLSQVEQHITITLVLPPALPAPQPVRAIGVAAPKHEAVMPQTPAPVSEVATDELADRNISKIYTCKKCGAEGCTFQELGQHSRKCKSV